MDKTHFSCDNNVVNLIYSYKLNDFIKVTDGFSVVLCCFISLSIKKSILNHFFTDIKAHFECSGAIFN